MANKIVKYVILLLETQDGENQHYNRSLVPVFESETPLMAAQRTAFCAYNSAIPIPVFDEHLEILKTYFN